MDLSVVTPREREVFDLLGTYLTHEQIAHQLVLSVRTVESHVASLRRKLDTPDHRALVRLAVEQRFSATRSAGAVPPTPLTSFVGREQELAALVSALQTARLVSAVGPGGVGKTRLAVAAAASVGPQLEHGVFWVDMVSVREVTGVQDAVAQACGAVLTSRRDPTDAVVAALRERRMLLVLDNCEHLVNAVSVLVERVLTACAGVTVLVTSRLRLAVPFEHVFAVAGLSTESDGDAVALFSERALAAGAVAPTAPERERISAVCAALGGLPLAIELAAARLSSLGIDGVEQGLLDQARLLTGGDRMIPRQRSMSQTLDWSLALVASAASTVVRRLAVFASPFELDKAVEVAAFASVPARVLPAALTELVEHNLLLASTAGGQRVFWMLEPIRQHGIARMTPEDQPAFARHLDWCLRATVAADAAPIESSLESRRLMADDVHAALAWGAAHGNKDLTAALARGFASLLFRAGSLREAQARFEQSAQLCRDPAQAVADLGHAAAIAKCRVRGEDALRLEVSAAEGARTAGNLVEAALAHARAAELLSRFSGMFAATSAPSPAPYVEKARALAPDDRQVAVTLEVVTCGYARPHGVATPEQARRALTVVRKVAGPILESAALDALISAHIFEHDIIGAHRLAQGRLERLRSASDTDPATGLELKDALHVATFCALGAGQLDTARLMARAQHELTFLRQSRDIADDELMAPAVLSGDLRTAIEVGERFLQDWEDAGRPQASARALAPSAIALAHGLLGNDRAREEWLAVVAEIRGVPRSDATHGTGHGELFDAWILLREHRPQQAFDLLTTDEDRGLYGAVFHQWIAALTAEAAIRGGRVDAQRWITQATAASAGNPIATAIIERAHAGTR